MRNIIRKRNFYIMLVLDGGLIAAAYLLSYFLRFEGEIPPQEWQTLMSTIPYILPFKLLLFLAFCLYSGMWRYTGIVDLFNVLKATTTSSVLIVLAILFINRFQGYPRAVFVIDWILTFILVGGIRVVIRLVLSEKERGLKFLFQNPFAQGRASKPKKRLLIIGAGDSGEKILRELRDNPRLE